MQDRILTVLTSGGPSTMLLALGATLMLAVAFDRLLEWTWIVAALGRVRRGRPARGLAATLARCARDARVDKGDEGVFTDVDRIREEVRLRMPALGMRWCDGRDHALDHLIHISPVVGLAVSIVLSAVQVGSSLTDPEMLMPTAIGVGTSAAAMLMKALVGLFNMPLRIARCASTARARPTRTSKPMVLRAHAAPTMAMVFFVAFGDLFFGLFVRAQRAVQHGSPVQAVAVQQVDGTVPGSQAPYLELYARVGGLFEFGGHVLPKTAEKRLVAIRQILAERDRQGRRPEVVGIAVWADPSVTQGELLPVKAGIQAALQRRGTPVPASSAQFEDRLLPSTRN